MKISNNVALWCLSLSSIGLLFLAVFLPTIVIVIIISSGPIIGAGGLWDVSKIISIIVLTILTSVILLPCLFSGGKTWLYPFFGCMPIALCFIYMVIYNLFLAEGAAFTYIAFIIVPALILTMLVESLIARSLSPKKC